MNYYWAAVVFLGVAVFGGNVALWKSATLSPDSIQRRVYWASCGITVMLVFIGALPDLRGGFFITAVFVLILVANAFDCTKHIKIRGRVYAAYPYLRTPDRPPALASEHEVD